MADNDWISGYLSAIVDQDDLTSHTESSGAAGFLEEKEGAVAVKYFLQEIAADSDSTIHKSWLKATAGNDQKEKGARLENFTWRIWHISLRRSQLRSEQNQRSLLRKKERDETREDLPEELSKELEDEHLSASQDDVGSDSGQARPDVSKKEGAEDERHTKKKLYIVMISLHGLIRGENMELGRDSDTGGQVKYAVELARALASMPEVYRVDLLTRQIMDPEVDWSYAEPTEMLTPMVSTMQAESSDYDSTNTDCFDVGGSAGAYIVRIPCGPTDKYLRKEKLWPYVGEFVDRSLSHIIHMAGVLGQQLAEARGDGIPDSNGHAEAISSTSLSSPSPVWPYLIHGHYADAGDIAAQLSGSLNVPMVLTGHSLGRNKLEQLLVKGTHDIEEIDAMYSIFRRIEGEEKALDSCELVVTSTRQEVDQQWGIYDGYDVRLERVLRARARRGVNCYGRFMPRMAVIPPGMDFSQALASSESSSSGSDEDANTPSICGQILRFFSNPHKPMILALARPDPKKNLTTLVKAFGQSQALRQLANLTLIMGNRDSIDAMPAANADVLTTVLKMIDQFDLYGHVAYPKHHKQVDVPHIYRLAARTKGVFVNPALIEPFGLTLIEAAAHGLPMVATQNGGPVDIHKALGNGLLVDPHDSGALAQALLQLLSNRSAWEQCHRGGLENIYKYSWPSHCQTFLTRVAQCRIRVPQWRAHHLLPPQSALTSPAMAAAAASALFGSWDSDSIPGGSTWKEDDMSLRLSIDGRSLRCGSSGSLSTAADLAARIFGSGRRYHVRHVSTDNRLMVTREEDGGEVEDVDASAAVADVVKKEEKVIQVGEKVRQMSRLIVVAVDSYERHGNGAIFPGSSFLNALRSALQLKENAGQNARIGVAVTSALPAPELMEALQEAGINCEAIDIVICLSGADIYYPCFVSEPGGSRNGPIPDTVPTEKRNWEMLRDMDYLAHSSYRWNADGVRKSMSSVVSPALDHAQGKLEGMVPPVLGSVFVETEQTSTRCLVYTIADAKQLPELKEMRARLRRRGLRCQLVHALAGTRLLVLPLHSSRVQALRYIFVRWGLELERMAVILGAAGDSDLVSLLSGSHGTLIYPDIDMGETSEIKHGTILNQAQYTFLPNVLQCSDSEVKCDNLMALLRRMRPGQM